MPRHYKLPYISDHRRGQFFFQFAPRGKVGPSGKNYVSGSKTVKGVGIFYVHFIYFTAIGCILWPLGIFSGYLVYSFPLWYVVGRKI
jgi:hypothetical protein